MTIRLGCIADDFTGGTDLANNLVRAGMRTVQVFGVPDGPLPDADAVVVALKSRTAPVAQAVAESLAAGRWLCQDGPTQLYFKVCSTFDSTPRGNIGPVAEALMTLVGATVVPVTPAFPENGRTVYMGHLFVGDQLLSDSSMRAHPLTPMTDANLVRVLQAQSPTHRVGLVDHRCVRDGADAILRRLGELHTAGVGLAIVDALADDDLHQLARASAALPLVVAGSGLAIGIPALHGLSPGAEASRLPAPSGHRAIVSGSCSAATNAQVAHFLSEGGAGFAVDALQVAAGRDVAAEALAWARERLGQAPLLVYATAGAERVRAVQAQLGAARAGALIEDTLAAITVGLVAAGVGQLIVAGGETSGACVQALGITQLRIGPQIDPGVPWCHASQGPLHLALKSGNFGSPRFFVDAFDRLT